jgi:hypothetical protein
MTQDFASLTRHPLHASILESFHDLRLAPSEKQASFTATLSRILSEAFIKNDPDYTMPAFLIDKGVTIARYQISDVEAQTPPGASDTLSSIIDLWHDKFAQAPTKHTVVTSAKFSMCSAYDTLQDLLDNPTLHAGGFLAFFDPIYDDSLILIHIKASSQADWHFRLIDGSVAA